MTNPTQHFHGPAFTNAHGPCCSALSAALQTIIAAKVVTDPAQIKAIDGLVILSREHARAMLAAL